MKWIIFFAMVFQYWLGFFIGRNYWLSNPTKETNAVDLNFVITDTIDMDRGSSYYPSLEQCARRDSLGNIDSTSNIYNTADGSFIDMEKLRKKEIQWCALPKSMLKEFGGSPFCFGDSIPIYCESKPHVNGKWVVHDVVSGKWNKTIDFLIHPDNNKNPKLGTPEDVKILIKK